MSDDEIVGHITKVLKIPVDWRSNFHNKESTLRFFVDMVENSGISVFINGADATVLLFINLPLVMREGKSCGKKSIDREGVVTFTVFDLSIIDKSNPARQLAASGHACLSGALGVRA